MRMKLRLEGEGGSTCVRESVELNWECSLFVPTVLVSFAVNVTGDSRIGLKVSKQIKKRDYKSDC